MSSKGKKTETRALSVQTAVQSGLTKTKDAGTKFFDYCVSKLEYVSAALVCAVMFLLGIFGSFDNSSPPSAETIFLLFFISP